MAERREIVNWYATRRHYADETSERNYRDYRGRTLFTGFASVCGKAWGCKSLEDDAAYRKRKNLSPRDYPSLPLCKFCERVAGQS